MNLKHIIFHQFLEDGEKINKSFRQNFPLFQLFLFLIITIGVAELTRWMFFCSYNQDFCPYESTGIYFYWGIIIFGLYKILKKYFNWYVNSILMTSDSILFISWKKLFSPKNKRLDYWDLDSVEIDRSGIKSYIGNFGTLIFNKINGGDPIVFKKIAQPHKVEAIILKNRERMVNEKNFVEESALKNILSELVQTHVQKNGQPERSYKSQEKIKTRINTSKKTKKKSFKNEIIEIEKKLDDTGGVNIDL